VNAATVVIDCFPDSVRAYREGYAVVAVDVIRATTTAVTAVHTGRRCFPVATLDEAFERAARLEQPLLVGELGGNMPFGFDMTNSPAAIAAREDVERPMVLLSSSGTGVVAGARMCDAVYLACFRNYAALPPYLAARHHRVAVIGAGSRGEFREEDQMCCAWIAEGLTRAGYALEDRRTEALVRRWSGAAPDACLASHSVEYLRRTGQLEDLDFILTHINDVPAPCMLKHDEVLLGAVPD
jgi:2-phosphosulfolactate phosphatase